MHKIEKFSGAWSAALFLCLFSPSGNRASSQPHWELPFPDQHFRWKECCCNVSMWVCCYMHINVP